MALRSPRSSIAGAVSWIARVDVRAVRESFNGMTLAQDYGETMTRSNWQSEAAPSLDLRIRKAIAAITMKNRRKASNFPAKLCFTEAK